MIGISKLESGCVARRPTSRDSLYQSKANDEILIRKNVIVAFVTLLIERHCLRCTSEIYNCFEHSIAPLLLCRSNELVDYPPFRIPLPSQRNSCTPCLCCVTLCKPKAVKIQNRKVLNYRPSSNPVTAASAAVATPLAPTTFPALATSTA